jgi:hypothetical protein
MHYNKTEKVLRSFLICHPLTYEFFNSVLDTQLRYKIEPFKYLKLYYF